MRMERELQAKCAEVEKAEREAAKAAKAAIGAKEEAAAEARAAVEAHASHFCAVSHRPQAALTQRATIHKSQGAGGC